MILYVNACARSESRTNILAKHLLEKLGDYTELKLYDMNLKSLDEEKLNKRTDLIEKGDYSDSMFDLAKQFTKSDTIVISAPYWDLSFPSILKTYIENIYITGIVSKYSDEGMPIGLCNAKKLYYVVTAGGKYNPSYSYEYISNLAKNCFGIKETELVVAEMLDICGNDTNLIMEEAKKKIDTTKFTKE